MIGYLDKPQYLAPLDDAKTEDDFSVITDRETIRFFAKNICKALRHPVTVLDINRMGTASSSELRIDSDLEYFSLRGACKLLRHCAGSEKCYQCDEFHAAILKDFVDNTQMKTDIDIKNAPSFFYDGYKNKPPKILTDFGRPVLEYHCPILGYRELLFPIYFESIIIGILFVGQSIVREAGDKDTVRKIVDNFFTKPENHPKKIFSEFLFEFSSEQKNDLDIMLNDSDEIKNLIIKADGLIEPLDRYLRHQRPNSAVSFRPAKMTFENLTQYIQFISEICVELEELEKCLKKSLQEKREKYFNKITREAVQTFFTQQMSHNESVTHEDKYTRRRKELKQAWDGFRVAADMIKKRLDLEEVLLFGDGVWLKMEETKTKRLYPRPKEDDPRFYWEYDFSKIANKHPTTYDFICSIESTDVLNGLCSKVNKLNVILLVYPDVAVLLRVKKINYNKNLYTGMVNVIGRSFSRIRSSVALCAANFIKEHHMLTLRMNRHESAHISTRLNDNMWRYFSEKGKAFLVLEKEKQGLVVDDMQNTIRLISHMASNIGLITGSVNSNTIKGKEKKLDVFDLLYKWQIMFRDKLYDRNLDLIVIRDTDNNVPYYLKTNDEDAPRFIKINSDLFELLVYNLVDNAVKYAYRGSVIYLGWRYFSGSSQCYQLSVSSFGPKIADDDNIYELYARGDTRHLHAVEGDGIGLYVVKRVGELLNLSVSHKCTYISPYYMPLIKWYIAESFINPGYKEKQAQLSEYLGNVHSSIFEDIINENSYTHIKRRDLSKEYLNKRINRETCLTTFNVTIPKTMKWTNLLNLEEGDSI